MATQPKTPKPAAKKVVAPAAKAVRAKQAAGRAKPPKRTLAESTEAFKAKAETLRRHNEEMSKNTRDQWNRVLAGPGDLKYTEFTPLVQQAFLTALSLCGNATRVCAELRISRVVMYQFKRETPEFQVAYDQAMGHAYEGWEDEVARRAFEGYQRPVYQMGMLVGSTTEYSDKLAEMMIRAGIPAKYNPKTITAIEHGGSMGIAVSQMSDEDLNKEINKKLAEMGAVATSRAEYLKLMGRDPE